MSSTPLPLLYRLLPIYIYICTWIMDENIHTSGLHFLSMLHARNLTTHEFLQRVIFNFSKHKNPIQHKKLYELWGEPHTTHALHLSEIWQEWQLLWLMLLLVFPWESWEVLLELELRRMPPSICRTPTANQYSHQNNIYYCKKKNTTLLNLMHEC